MAFCKYCGRDIPEGENCTCPQALADLQAAAEEQAQPFQPAPAAEAQAQPFQPAPAAQMPPQPGYVAAPQPPIAPPVQPMKAPKTTKPRSAYVAAILHILFGVFGFGYYYRGDYTKAKNCWIMLIAGAAGSALFGLGAIVILVCQIINFVEAVKLFAGKYPTDSFGRELVQEF